MPHLHLKISDGFVLLLAAILILTIGGAAAIRGEATGMASVDIGNPRFDCISGDFRCTEDKLQYCRQGNWINQEICAKGCRNNACIADKQCTEDSYRCLSRTTCDIRSVVRSWSYPWRPN